MKVVSHMLDRMRPLFEEGGKLARWHPVFQAASNIFFSASVPAEHPPYGRDPIDVKRFMTMVIIALVPCAAAGVYFFGLRVLLMILVSYAAGGVVEVLFAVIRKEEINEGFLVTGLIFALVLPPALPLWMVALGCAFGVLVGKEIFGGTGRNPFNPALVGRCFLFIAYPGAMATNWIMPGAGWPGRLLQYVGSTQTDAVCAATPLVLAKQGTFASMQDLFTGAVGGSVGETSALAILLGGALLMATRIANWRTVAATLGSFAIPGVLLHALFPAAFGPTAWHMLAGGLLFGAMFMATDPVSSPLTNGAKWLYGILIGVTALLIRNLTGYVEGVTFSILLGNIFAPSFDEIVYRRQARRFQRER